MTFIAEMSVRTNSKLRAHGSFESNPTTLEQREEQYNDRSPFMKSDDRIIWTAAAAQGKSLLLVRPTLCMHVVERSTDKQKGRRCADFSLRLYPLDVRMSRSSSEEACTSDGRFIWACSCQEGRRLG